MGFHYVAVDVPTSVAGRLLLGRTAAGICWLSLGAALDPQRGEMADQLGRHGGEETPAAERPVLAARAQADARAVAAALDGEAPLPQHLPLELFGTEFQLAVWEELRKLTPRDRRTYSDIAQALGRESSARAVASAVAANPVSLLVPCHQVVRRDGGLGGYRWGTEIKARLLDKPDTFAAAG